jgi:hypothetical protein
LAAWRADECESFVRSVGSGALQPLFKEMSNNAGSTAAHLLCRVEARAMAMITGWHLQQFAPLAARCWAERWGGCRKLAPASRMNPVQASDALGLPQHELQVHKAISKCVEVRCRPRRRRHRFGQEVKC